VGFFRKAAENFLGLVFPNRCVICDRPMDPSRRSPVCLVHAREIVAVEPPVCSKCGRKMSAESVEELVCARCRAMKLHYDAGYSTHAYTETLRELIHLFKYRKRRYLRSFLGGLVLDYVRGHAGTISYDAIVPVPLHWRRHWRRGFNQAAHLAGPLSKNLRIPILKRSIKRVRHTRPQVGLPAEQRRDNIKNAFKVTRPEKVAGKKLFVIDDVITSGATLNECARVLKKAGASEITILTLSHPSDYLSSANGTSLPGGRLQI